MTAPDVNRQLLTLHYERKRLAAIIKDHKERGEPTDVFERLLQAARLESSAILETLTDVQVTGQHRSREAPIPSPMTGRLPLGGSLALREYQALSRVSDLVGRAPA